MYLVTMHLIPTHADSQAVVKRWDHQELIMIKHTDLKKARLEIGLSLFKHSGTNLLCIA